MMSNFYDCRMAILIILMLGVDGIQSLCSTGLMCPPDWILNEQSCWKPLPRPYYMPLAEEACRQMDGHVAVPNSKAENDFLHGLFRRTWPDTTTISFLLGCKGNPPSSVLDCVEELTEGADYYRYTPSSNSAYKCVVMGIKNGTFWSSCPCSNYKRYAICEKPATRRVATALGCTAVNIDDSSSYCLLDHTFFVMQTKSSTQCCIACFNNVDCLSFNLSGHGKTCHLSNVTISQIDQGKYFKPTDDCSYYETKWAN